MHEQLTPDTELRGRVVVVTGAGSGMGRVIALELARRGAKLAAVDVRCGAARAPQEEAGTNAAEFLAVPTDISRADECRHRSSVPSPPSESRDTGELRRCLHGPGNSRREASSGKILGTDPAGGPAFKRSTAPVRTT